MVPMSDKVKFFVKTDDGHTNEAIACVPSMEFSEDKKAWTCDFKTILVFLKSKSNAVLKFKVSVDLGDGILREFKIQPVKSFRLVVSQVRTRLALMQRQYDKQNVSSHR